MEIHINGSTVVIDDNDAAFLLSLTLTIGKNGYVQVRGSRRKGCGNSHLARVLLRPASGLHVDHINGNKLDNRRENLRTCNHTENMRNRKPRVSITGYKGVFWSKNKKTYVARVVFQGKRYMSGTSSDPIKAAKKYDRRARELHGEFARPNFSCGCWVDQTCPVCLAPSPWRLRRLGGPVDGDPVDS